MENFGRQTYQNLILKLLEVPENVLSLRCHFAVIIAINYIIFVLKTSSSIEF